MRGLCHMMAANSSLGVLLDRSILLANCQQFPGGTSQAQNLAERAEKLVTPVREIRPQKD